MGSRADIGREQPTGRFEEVKIEPWPPDGPGESGFLIDPPYGWGLGMP
jgi:hypothetical protein